MAQFLQSEAVNDNLLPFGQSDHGVTRSTSEAMKLLARHRRVRIDRARDVAREIARADGTVNCRQVRERMKADGLLRDPENGRLVPATEREHWLGSIFRHPDFEQTGQQVAYTNALRNIHERTVNVWRLRNGSGCEERP